jgi:outer membrane protein OmpA-like peptidoglycan-associated protein
VRLAALLALACLGATAHADDDEAFSVDVERFRPHMGTHGYGVTEGVTSLGHLEVGVGLWGHYAEDSVVLVWDGERVLSGEGTDGVIDQRSTTDLQLGVGFVDRIGLSIDVPLVLWQKGLSLEHLQDPSADEDLISSGIGDVRAQLALTVVDLDDQPVGLAIVVRGSAPTGAPFSLLGEGAPTVTPMLVIEAADGSVRDKEYQFRIAANAGLHLRERDRFRDVVLDDEFVYAGAIGVRPAPWTEFALEVHGSIAGPRAAHRPMELAPMLIVHPGRDIQLIGGASLGLLPGLGSPDVRLFLGGTISPSFDPKVRDRDKDGIVDKHDACKNIPEDLDGWGDEDGCPEDDFDGDGILDPVDQCPANPEDLDGWEDEDGCPDIDNDDDGILDADDECPNDPETVNGFEDQDGCPDDGPDSDGDGIPDGRDSCPRQAEDFDGWEDEDGCPDLDNDRDRYLDVDDACPDHAEVWNGWRDEDGCPDSADDSDGDGILDEVDQCPEQPEDLDGWEDLDGCPDVDNDKDGLLDVNDECPNQAEVVNDYLDQDGCPDIKPTRVTVARSRIMIEEQVHFDVDRATIKADSGGLLDEIARTLVDHPELLRVRIEGHTDSDGEALYNLRLSQERAESVVAALVARGVDARRLVPVGLGESRPIASNGDSAGKARNRRVELHIEERED